MEKLRPEKELERARKEILRRKVKIRELFQHVDTLCAEGSIPESLFDSGGEISSEDVRRTLFPNSCFVPLFFFLPDRTSLSLLLTRAVVLSADILCKMWLKRRAC